MKYKVTKKAMRPASKAEKCFYCKRPVGGVHTKNCVLVRRTVLIETKITHEIQVPSCMNPDDVEFMRNEGTWCASNLIEELKKLEKDNDCLCGLARAKFVRFTSVPFLREAE